MNGTSVLIAAIAVAIAFAVYLLRRLPELTGGRAGRWLLFATLLVMPGLMLLTGVTTTLKKSTQREFCRSCHEMQYYEKSLLIDDSSFLPAVHFQKGLIPAETACYECHTDYTLFGSVSAKFDGMKHAWVHFLGTVPEPGKIEPYHKYPNKNCLRCHAGARPFEENEKHIGEDAGLAKLYADEVSCLAKGCHDVKHKIAELGGLDFWKPTEQAIKAKNIDLAPLDKLELPGGGEDDLWE